MVISCSAYPNSSRPVERADSNACPRPLATSWNTPIEVWAIGSANASSAVPSTNGSASGDGPAARAAASLAATRSPQRVGLDAGARQDPGRRARLTVHRRDHGHPAAVRLAVRGERVVGPPDVHPIGILDEHDATVGGRRVERPFDKLLRGCPARCLLRAHAPASETVLRMLTPRKRADGHPWLTGAT